MYSEMVLSMQHGRPEKTTGLRYVQNHGRNICRVKKLKGDVFKVLCMKEVYTLKLYLLYHFSVSLGPIVVCKLMDSYGV